MILLSLIAGNFSGDAINDSSGNIVCLICENLIGLLASVPCFVDEEAIKTMSQEPSNSLIKLGNVLKPAETLIKKISKGVGGLAAPWQIKRVAEAEIEAAHSAAEVARIEAHSEIEIADLHQRAEQRRIEENTRYQKNMEDITAKAMPHLNEEANPDAMEDDWIANFFDKCRIVSDNEMQSLWSRVLAGEANAPGTYAKRTVNLIAELDKSDAELFTQLCGFGWMIENLFTLLMFDETAEIYNSHKIDFDTLSHLNGVGLIQVEYVACFTRTSLPRKFEAYYYGKPLPLEIFSVGNNVLEIGKILLTKIGRELAPICGSKPVDGFYEYVKNQWWQYRPTVENSKQTE